MGRREEIDRLQQIAYESEDLPTLEAAHRQAVEMVNSINSNLASAADADVRELLMELKSLAEYAEEELKRRTTEIRVEMMDPNYGERKAAKEREKAEEQAREDAMRKKFETEGFAGVFKELGSVFGGLTGAAAGLGGQAAKTAGSPAAAGPACAACGAEIQGTPKFCSECGAPVPQERRCGSCNTKLNANVKFCPECGTKAS